MQTLTYEETVTAIENKRRFGNLKGVEISKIMLEQLGHPEKDLRIIHIAGTNGKGSVSAFLRSVFECAGSKTGMFTSPHLVDFRERIQVQGDMISKEDTMRIGNRLLSMDFGVCPTMFDYCLAMALLYFKEQKCDVVILETGLGGIIKHGTALVLESQEKEAMDVLNKAAERADIKTTKVVNLDEIRILPQKDGKQCFSYAGYDAVTMKMLGVHQYENAVAAMLAAELFFEKYFAGKKNVPERKALQHAIREGIDRTQWMGRMELVSNDPFFLMDGAHNSNGVEALKKSLETMYPDEKFHFIMGVMADKDYGEMIRELLPLALDFKTVTVESERALQGEALADCIRAKGIPAEAYQNLADVLPDFSKSSAEKTVAFGSLYFIGEIKAFLQGKQ